MLLDILCHLASVGERERRIDAQPHLGVQPVTKPPRANRLHANHAPCMLRRVAKLANYGRLHAIKHSSQHGFRRLPDDTKDCSGDEQGR